MKMVTVLSHRYSPVCSSPPLLSLPHRRAVVRSDPAEEQRGHHRALIDNTRVGMRFGQDVSHERGSVPFLM